MYRIITAITLIMFPIVAVTYYAVKKDRNVNYNGRFLKLKATVNNDTNFSWVTEFLSDRGFVVGRCA